MRIPLSSMCILHMTYLDPTGNTLHNDILSQILKRAHRAAAVLLKHDIIPF
jgi:hypothetical protein